MLTRKILFSLLFIFLLASCAQEESFRADVLKTDVKRSELSARSQENRHSTSVAIQESPTGEMLVIPGAYARLNRTANGITANFKTKNLIPGNAYTLWFVVFPTVPGPPSSTFAAGHIAGGSGKATFSGHLRVGDSFDDPRHLTAFEDPLTAEVHLALRTHGPAQPGMIPTQIHTMNGGCVSGFPSGPILYPDSDEAGYCANIQVAMHPGH